MFNKIRHTLGIDKAIAFSVLGRGWTTLAGLLSVTLIARFLTPAAQGYYYTFWSLVALQIVFELGFSFVILQLAAHERAHLEFTPDGEIVGNERSKARLASILQKAVRWYTIAAIVMALVLLAVGFYFFARQSTTTGDIHWRLPWVFVVIASSVTFQIDPVVSFLEGCGKVAQVGRLRLTQGIVGSFLSWGALLLHHGLYSPGLMIVGQAAAGLAFLYSNRSLLRPLMRVRPGTDAVNWAIEVWPFQWRVAVSWASSYFILQMMNPIVFSFRGAVEAGRMGMSLNIANSLGAVALAWMTTKASPFGQLIARRQFTELDDLFFRSLKQSTAILILGIVTLMLLFPEIFHFFPRFQNRILPLPYLGILFATLICNHIVVSEAYYLRAHKREPFLFFWVAIAVITGVTLLWVAKFWGSPGIVIGYFCCGGLLRVSCGTFAFVKKRREWRTNDALADSMFQ